MVQKQVGVYYYQLNFCSTGTFSSFNPKLGKDRKRNIGEILDDYWCILCKL